jgi:hypothetical protein
LAAHEAVHEGAGDDPGVIAVVLPRRSPGSALKVSPPPRPGQAAVRMEVAVDVLEVLVDVVPELKASGAQGATFLTPTRKGANISISGSLAKIYRFGTVWAYCFSTSPGPILLM